MGHITIKATFYNAVDYARWKRGEISEADVRKFAALALVDTGATYPALPEDVVESLALPDLGEVEGEVAEGRRKLNLAGLVIIGVEDRIAGCPVIVRPKGTMPLLGVVALEQMGYRVDPVTGKLVKGLPFML